MGTKQKIDGRRSISHELKNGLSRKEMLEQVESYSVLVRIIPYISVPVLPVGQGGCVAM